MVQQNPKTEENWRDVLAQMEEKIDFLILQVDRLNRTINPPIWKQAMKWGWRNLFPIVAFIILGIFLWNLWESFEILSAKIEAILELPSQAKDSLWDAAERLKFW